MEGDLFMGEIPPPLVAAVTNVLYGWLCRDGVPCTLYPSCVFYPLYDVTDIVTTTLHHSYGELQVK